MGDFDFFGALNAFVANGVDQKQAERQLNEWGEAYPADFIRATVSTITADVDGEVSAEHRFIAAAALVSFMKLHSRLVPGDAMNFVRDSLLNALLHDDALRGGLARKACQVLARVAREEYPRSWAEMPDHVLALVASDDSRGRSCGLLLAHCIMTELHAVKVDDAACMQAATCFAEPVTQWLGTLGNSLLNDADANVARDMAQFILAAKVAQRVFSCVVNEAVVQQLSSLLVDLLHCSRAAELEACVERVLKVLMWIVDEKVTTIGELVSASFFHDFLPLLADLIERFATPKVAGRAMKIFSRLLEFMDASDFVAQVMADFFGNEGDTRRMLTVLVQNYFGDDMDRSDDWLASPEDFVIDHDVNDDNDELDKCAEALFLSILEQGGDTVRDMGWSVINEFLTGEHSGDYKITAALRAIGVSYRILAETDAAKEQYRNFLHTTLLPLITNSSMDVSEFVLRRVIWVIGMWCCNLPSIEDRVAVHNALSGVLNSSGDAVIVMTTLRTLENFISDELFDPSQMSMAEATLMFNVIEKLVPGLETPGMIKEMANLVLSTFTKGVRLPSEVKFGQSILKMFRSTMVNFMHADEHAEDGEDQSNCAAFCAVLDAIAGGVHLFERSEDIWGLHGVVAYCTNTENCVHTWTEGHAWDLLGAMCRATNDIPNAAIRESMLEALRWSVETTERDFDGLPGCLRAISALSLLFLANDDLADDALAAVCGVSARLVSTVEGEPYDEAVALADVLCVRASAAAGQALFGTLLQILREPDDVQSESRAAGAALLLCRLLSSVDGPSAWSSLDDAAKSDVCERLGLTIDVTPSWYASRLIVATLSRIAASNGLPARDDVEYVRQCVASDNATAAERDEQIARGELDAEGPFEMYLAAIKDDTKPEQWTAHHRRLQAIVESSMGSLEIHEF